MLKLVIDSSLRHRFVALALVALMALGGAAALVNLPINSLPDVTPVQVLVITKAGRYSPYDVERLVSFPIETTMNGLPDVSEVRSISHFGLSAVTVEFEEGTDIYFARQLVSQRVQSVVDALPEGVSAPQLGPISTALGEIYQYTVHGDGYSLTELRTIQDWLIAPQLKTVQGVTEVNSFGGFVKQYEVVLDPEALRAAGLGIAEVGAAIEANNAVSGGNFLEHNREQYIVRGFGQIRSQEDIEDIVVAKLAARPVYVRDVAEVRVGRQLRQGAVTQDGQGEVVTGIVMMLRGGDGREVIRQVEARIEEVNRGLPEGVRIEKFYDQSDLVERTTSTLRTNLLEGGFFVIAVLLLLLGEIRGALIVASVIPLSMLFAFIGMREFGLAANLMSLGAIDFGMVVDGSVVMIENMTHRLQENEGRKPTLQVVREAAHEVARPIFFGVLIILMVYVPIATFRGMEGILYRPMAITVATAVFGSLILALVYVPAMAALIFRRGVRIRPNRLIGWLKPRYRWILERSLERRPLVFGTAGIVFATSILLMPFLGTEFLPELDEGSILVEQVRMPSVTLEESVANADWIAGELQAAIPEIRTVVPKTGRSDLANDWMGVHQTDVWVILQPRDEWRPGMTKASIEDAIRPYLESEPGLSYNFTQPIAMRVDELTSGVKSDVAVKIFGEDLETLNRVGEAIVRLAPDLPGTENVFLERAIGQPYLTVEIDRDAIASFGLNVSDVQEIIETGVGGRAVAQVFEGQRRFDIVLRFPEGMRDSFRELMDVPVPLADGAVIPLHRVATVTAQEGPREIAREDGWRRVIVGMNLADIDIGSYVANLQDAIDERVDLPGGVFLRYGGAFEEQQRAMRHLFVVVPLALFIIFGLLYMMFGQVRYALMILLNLPFALSGGVFILWVRGLYLSVSASIGFVALFGVAVLNGIVLISHLNDLRREGRDVRTATLEGATDRLRPVLMTALVASLGFIPMAFNVGPGSEVQRPLASVVIGGLVTATLLTLLVLPTLYHWLERDERVPAGAGDVPWQEPTRPGPVSAGTAGLAFLLLGLGCPPALQAQDAPAEELTVRAAIEMALERNPALNRRREQVRAIEGRRLTGFGLPSPHVLFTEEGVPTDGAPDLPAFAERKWSLSQRIRSPVESYFEVKSAGVEAEAARLMVASEAVQVRTSVKSGYVALVHAREILRLREQELALAQGLDEAVQTRVMVGEAAELDRMKAQLQAAEAESGLAEALRRLEVARYGLLEMIGLEPEAAPVSLIFPDTLAYVPIHVTREEVVAALDRLPAVRSADERRRAAGLAVDGAWGAAFPSLDLQVFSQNFGTGYDFWGFQVGLSVPIWFFLNERGNADQARARARGLEWERLQVTLALERQAEEAWHGYRTSLELAERYTESVNVRADELLELTQEGYLVGELDLLELLDTQRTVLASRKRYWDALGSYYRSLIELERFVGRELVFLEAAP